MTTQAVLLMSVLLAGWLGGAPPAARDNDYAQQRQRLVETVEEHVRETSDYLGRVRLDSRVMKAIGTVPRHEFVPANLRDRAYENRPLPIGHSQTISQPYIVAIMTDLIDLGPQDRVLEIGTGSGYQSAVLAHLASKVYSMETVDALVEPARRRLAELGYTNIEVKHGNGYYGWPEHAPYDGILVTAAAPRIPPALIEQLKPGARLVIPVGQPWAAQMLKVIRKQQDGAVTEDDILPVAFVPLTGAQAE